MSSIAVFLILGGATAFAASHLGKNSVGSKQLKKNAVTTAKIKKAAVTGAKIKLSTLGTVPSATSATNATNAVNATNAANAAHAATAGSTEQIKTWSATASIGQTVPLLTIGPFSYKGECSSGPHAVTIVTTSQPNSAADSYADEFGYTSSQRYPFEPGEELSVGYESNEHVTDGNPQWVGPYDGSDTQISGDGHTFVNTFASVGTKILGVDCIFVGHANVINR
jgi:hypothetical protein